MARRRFGLLVTSKTASSRRTPKAPRCRGERSSPPAARKRQGNDCEDTCNQQRTCIQSASNMQRTGFATKLRFSSLFRFVPTSFVANGPRWALQQGLTSSVEPVSLQLGTFRCKTVFRCKAHRRGIQGATKLQRRVARNTEKRRESALF